jgi:hypothetical protein
MEQKRMERTFVFDGHEYQDADGRIFDSSGELVGTVLLDVAKEYWIVELVGDVFMWEHRPRRHGRLFNAGAGAR